jgi:hypothetical protein
VRAFGSGCLSGTGWIDGLRREQAAWYAEVLQKPLPWYAEEKVRSGAFAALLGLDLSASGTWSSLAVGDCCLLQWRAGALVEALPAQDSTYFTSRPYLLSSNSARNDGLADQAQWAEGAWQPGDWFALMSDALAQWAWRSLEAGIPPWGALEELSVAAQQRPFLHWIDELRSGGELRNDDVTLLLVLVE